jgi:hypothetical protein
MLTYARDGAGVVRGIGWTGGWDAVENLYFYCIYKLVKLIYELLVIHCASLCLQFSLVRVYVSRCIGARRLSFFRAGSRDVTVKVVSELKT